MTAKARIRMVAGPNGSGKTTVLRAVLSKELLGVFVNPDEIEQALVTTKSLALHDYGIEATRDELLAALRSSEVMHRRHAGKELGQLSIQAGKLLVGELEVDSYWASTIAGFIRQRLLELRSSFTFETVMSSPDKIEVMKSARKSGYRLPLLRGD